MSTKKVDQLTEEDIKFLFNELRKASLIWDGRKEILRLSRKKVFLRRAKNGNPVYKFHWQCKKCENWFEDEKYLEVDHVDEIGGITGFTGDWNETISKIFPRPVSLYLQVLCIPCHLKKTKQFMAASHKYTRKVKQ